MPHVVRRAYLLAAPRSHPPSPSLCILAHGSLGDVHFALPFVHLFSVAQLFSPSISSLLFIIIKHSIHFWIRVSVAAMNWMASFTDLSIQRFQYRVGMTRLARHLEG